MMESIELWEMFKALEIVYILSLMVFDRWRQAAYDCMHHNRQNGSKKKKKNSAKDKYCNQKK